MIVFSQKPATTNFSKKKSARHLPTFCPSFSGKSNFQMTKKLTALAACLAAATFLFGQKDLKNLPKISDEDSKTYPMQHSQGHFIGDIAPLREPSPALPDLGKSPKTWEKKNYFSRNKTTNPAAEPQGRDPLADLHRDQNGSAGAPPIFPGLNFEGLRETGATPPDPTGDIGKNHYVQSVNRGGGSSIKIWDKDGKVVLDEFASSQKMWSQVGFSSIGDPIVQYDHAAERWLFLEMQGFGNNELLIAISNTSDPTGGWKGYRFQTFGFPDYPKLYVWNNAYFITVNEIAGNNRAVGYALERDAMIAGKDKFGVWRFEMPKFAALTYQPATGTDWEGGIAPPANSPGYIFRMYDDAWGGIDADHLQVWQVKLNWTDTIQNQLVGPQKVYVAPFESNVCNGNLFECIDQPDANSQKITALDDIIMYRCPYRNFGTYESIVLNHVVDVAANGGDGGDAQIRWYELRKTAANPAWTVAQQGTHAPDAAAHRFMSTLSQDAQGNIALGYSVSSKTVYPGLRISAHRAADAPGQMSNEEFTIMDGKASHRTFRWGDYSSMAVDPVDGRTFWFTGEYQPAGNVDWGTRIMSFQLRRDTFDARPKTMESPKNSHLLSTAEKITVQVFNEGLQPAVNVKVRVKLDGKNVVEEPIAGSILPNTGVLHTFSPTVDLSVPNRTYTFDFITNYQQDQYHENDSIAVPVKKLTSNDGALVPKTGVANSICSSEATYDVIFKNAAAVPLQSLKVKYKLGASAEETFNWTGNLPAGEQDTLTLALSNVKNGNNFLTLILAEPNGIADEDRSNDTLRLRLVGQITGSPCLVDATATQGQLNWEIRDQQTGSLVASGSASSNLPAPRQICLNDGKCFQLFMKATPLKWEGKFQFFDLFGKLLVERQTVTGEETITFCTPTRLAADLGAFELLSPKTGKGLTAAETVQVAARNFGKNAQTGVQIRYRIGGGAWQTETLPGTLQAGETQIHTFATTADLSQLGDYPFEIETIFPNDEQPSNDRISPVVKNRAGRDLAISGAGLLKGCGSLDDVFVKYSVENQGFAVIDSFKVEIRLDGVFQKIESHKVLLGTGDQVELKPELTLPDFNQHLLEVKIVETNGSPLDEFLANNTAQANIQIQQNGVEATALFSLDSKPQETSWKLFDEQGNVVLSSSKFAATDQFLTDFWCLAPEKCFTFRLYDSGGDGMLGSISISNLTGTLLDFDGKDFGDSIDLKFCTKTLCGGFAATAQVSPASAVGVSDGKIVVTPTGGTPPFFYGLKISQLFADSIFTGLAAGKYTVFVVDGNFCEFKIEVEVKVFVSSDDLVFGKRALQISPNPAQNFVQIELPARSGEQTAVAELFDLNGKSLRSFRLSRWDDSLHGVFSVEKLPAGQYFVRVRGLDKVYLGKVLKQ